MLSNYLKDGTAFPIVVLAGGLGSRLGGHKPQAMLAGSTLLDRAISKAASYTSPVAVSLGVTDLRLPDYVRKLQDEQHMQGPIAGLAASLKFASSIDASHVMIMPCDTPFLPPDLFQRLMNSIGTSLVAVAQYDGQLHPTCSLWRTDAGSLLPNFHATGRRSLIGFAEAAEFMPVNWPNEAVDPFLNINTREELSHAEQIFAQL